MSSNIIDIINSGRPAVEIIAALKNKTITVRPWFGRGGLRDEYDPSRHPIMDKSRFPDIVSEGIIERVTRITYDLQRLATKRAAELVCGIPVKRVYSAVTDKQKEVATYLEAVFNRSRINAVNVDRVNKLFAGCEVMTLWHATLEPNTAYGFSSPIKLRCQNFTPMHGDSIFPLFDEFGDMVALSVGYTRRVGNVDVSFFDAFTAARHIKWSNAGGEWRTVEDEENALGKIPAVYVFRPTPIWEDTSRIVYEMEEAMSRNGNYLRKNSKPVFAVFADEQITYGDEEDGAARSIIQYPKGSSAQYITWPQAVDNLKFYVAELRQSFFTLLQLPDWSYESMKSVPMSGESRKQLFIDAQLKVKDESGRLLEFFDREVNVIKAFLKKCLPADYAQEVDALEVETVITPFTLTDEMDRINNLMTANGGLPIMSQRESIERFAGRANVDKTLQEIKAQQTADLFEPTE